MVSRIIKILVVSSISAFSSYPVRSHPITRTRLVQPKIVNTNFDIIDNLLKTEIYNKPMNHIVIEQLSALLPKLDGFSHVVLKTNSNIINHIIADDTLSYEMKRKLILFTIKVVQDGDNVGSQILQTYFDIVNHCLQLH